jgi:hypothetical protein
MTYKELERYPQMIETYNWLLIMWTWTNEISAGRALPAGNDSSTRTIKKNYHHRITQNPLTIRKEFVKTMLGDAGRGVAHVGLSNAIVSATVARNV